MTLRSVALTISAITLLAAGQASGASKVSQSCEVDFHKLCPTATAGRGAIMRCVKTQLDAVTPGCKSAVESAQAAKAARKAARAAAKSGSATPASS